MEIKIQPFDIQLTSRGFFSVFEQYNRECTSAERAYEKVEEYCVEQKLAIKYSSFISFKYAYYRHLNRRRAKK